MAIARIQTFCVPDGKNCSATDPYASVCLDPDPTVMHDVILDPATRQAGTKIVVVIYHVTIVAIGPDCLRNSSLW